ncbi:GatB/YqeY domain-containing protein [Candidatus Daviesbacteria bacterium]|nr:GatB/YqeY domain-containing protein [Candidatus Daviesbacteria bacterium]
MLDKIQENLKQAQLKRFEVEVLTLRLLISEINNAKIQKGSDLTEDEIVSVIQREAKKRREAIEGFRKGDREELAQKEESELKILESYLPEELSSEELTKIVEDAINDVGAKNLAEMGKVMEAVMGKVKGRADGGTVSQLVREKLTNS